MQSGGYGGVSEFQQFIMDGAFAMSAPPPQQHQQQQHPGSQGPAPAAAAAAGQQEPFRYQPLLHHALPPHHHHHHHHHAPPMPPHFAHFAGGGGIPFTQQLLHHHPHLQLFQEQQHHHQKQQQQPVAARWGAHHHNPHGHHQQQHLGFDVEAAVPESSGAASPAPPNVPPFLAAAMNFKLGVDAGGGSGATGGTDVNDGMLHEEAATESRLRRWPGDEEAAIKEPTWRPLDIDYLHSSTSSSKNKETKAATPESPPPPSPPAANYLMKKDGNAEAAGAAGGNNYKLFSELEAIYKPGSSSGGPAHQTGSGSGLTGDDILAEPPLPEQLPHPHPQVVNVNVNMNNTTNMSETSAGEDVAAMVVEQQHSQQQELELEQEPPSSSGAVMTTKNSNRRKKRRRSQEHHQLSASSSFFERLVQRLMEHQESLHRQFLDAMERRERERAARDEAWRRQEADKFAREAAARAQDRASAAAREAAIIAYLEKLSGETITLPEPPPAAATEHDMGGGAGEKDNKEMTMLMSSTGGGHSRWPKHEVEALIRVRTGLEGRFQEPGLKGPLWEEVSSRMTAAGYGRSAKRCKEKWENINKYFRKAKESGKKRPSQAKTCPYFQELDRLYSRTSPNNVNSNAEKASSSELLDAVVNKGPPGFSFDSGTDHNAAVEAIVKGGAEDDVEAKEDEAREEEARPTTQDQVEDSHGDDDH